ncbi:MAG: FtsH protease activity modulator HflK [Deltaproteobacteria bacterium]|nr:FtsH protease activity modulator HflK [Deltaproteobacteria bacterium]
MPWDWDKLQKKRRRVMGGGPGGDGNPSPEVDDIFDKVKKYSGRKPSIPIIVLVVIVLWGLSGIYIVAPDESGVVKRFGKFIYTTAPGPHYHLPMPIEDVTKAKVTQVKRIEIGFRTISPPPNARYQPIPEEGLMLTGDENIVDIQFIVQYKVKDAADYEFNVLMPDKVLKAVAQSAIREIMGRSKIDEVLTTDKNRIQIESKNLGQSIMDQYGAGTTIVAVQLQDVHPPQQVVNAFKDVASAKEDKIKVINEAQGYQNDILPKAKGQASKIIYEAEAYKATKVNAALGDANRFLQQLTEYKNAKDITRKRMYIDALEGVMSNSTKIILDDKIQRNVLPFLPLTGLPGESAKTPKAGAE